MEKANKDSFIYVFSGILLFVIGIFAIVQQTGFVMQVFHLLGWVFIIHGFVMLYNHYIKKQSHTIDLPIVVLNIFGGLVIIAYPNIPVYLSTIIFALYVSLNGITRFLIYLNYRKDNVAGRMKVLLLSLFLFINGTGALLTPALSSDMVARLIGIYACLLGIRFINDGKVMMIPKEKKDILKRKLRVSLPMFLTAFIPKIMMDYINDHLRVEDHYELDDSNSDVNLEIFIHVSLDGFGTMGHCDICLDGEVISYGNYDYSSIGLFEAMGDGVLMITNKEKYIPFCVAEGKKTIFGYGFHLTDIQLQSIRDGVRKLKDTCYPWYPPAFYNHQVVSDYASRVYLQTGCSFYKFRKGKFKSYFVLGTNCVLLAEELVGKSGQDIININGIITPGTYQDYLEKEYQRMNSPVVIKKIYNKYTLVHK